VSQTLANLATSRDTVTRMQQLDPDALYALMEELNLWMGDTDSRLRSYARRAILNLVANGFNPSEKCVYVVCSSPPRGVACA